MPLLAAVFLSYMGLLAILATASPGGGLLGLLLQLLPSRVLDCLHAPAYGLLAWIGITLLQRRGWPQPLALGAGSVFVLVFGLWTEILQLSVPGRGLEIKDLLIDGIGIVAANIIVLWRPIPMRVIREAGSRCSIATVEDSA